MRRLALFAVAVLLLRAGPLYAHADSMTLEVIPLHYRMADEVMPVLQPLLAPGGTISGMNNQLIIRTTPSNLEEIKQVLAGIDLRQRRLVITVRQDSGERARLDRRSLSGRYTSGDVTVGNTSHGGAVDGTAVALEDGHGNRLRVEGDREQAALDDRNTFRVQTLDGQAAYIETGEAVPVTERTVFRDGERVVEQRGVAYQKTASGFYVVPRLNGDRVTLLVSPYLSRVSGGQRPAFDIQNVETTATARLGEWISLGGIDREESREGSRNLDNRSLHRTSHHAVSVRVDEIP